MGQPVTAPPAVLDRRRMRRYLITEAAAYQRLVEENPSAEPIVSRLEMWARRTRRACVEVVDLGYEIPPGFFQPYAIEKSEFTTTRDGDGKIIRRPAHQILQLKYQLRGYNLMREYLRCIKFFPEVLSRDHRYDILELSSGSCALAEISREFGNGYTGVDFTSGRGFVYEAIHRAIGIEVGDFDGSKLPYVFDENSQDVVVCFQAIDAYGTIEQYPDFIHEMLRIARRRVVIGFNSGLGRNRFDFDEAAKPVLEKAFPSAQFAKSSDPQIPIMILETGKF